MSIHDTPVHRQVGERPPCFDDQQQWEDCVALDKIARRSGENETYCDDCTPEHRDNMVKAGRCGYPSECIGIDYSPAHVRQGLITLGGSMATPEGRIKDIVKRSLKNFQEATSTHFYVHWPVLIGYGTPELDCNVTINGFSLSIETKAPGEKPTPRQWITIEDKRRAGVVVLVFSGTDEDLNDLSTVMTELSKGWHSYAQSVSTSNLDRYRG